MRISDALTHGSPARRRIESWPIPSRGVLESKLDQLSREMRTKLCELRHNFVSHRAGIYTLHASKHRAT